MQAIFKRIKIENKNIKQSYILQVSKYGVRGALLKQELLLFPTGVYNTRKTRNFLFSMNMIRSFKSSRNRVGGQWPPRTIDGVRWPPPRWPSSASAEYRAANEPLAIERVPQNLWLTPIFNYGGHLGHKSTKVPISRAWLPPMGDYLVGNRNRVAVINSHLALERAAKGLYLSATVLRRKGHILVVDTRGEASPLPNLIENSNHRIPTSISFSGPRWIGGTLTNWTSISVMVRRCAQISKQFDSIVTQNRTHIPRYEKMRDAFPGFIKTSCLYNGKKQVLDPLKKTGKLFFPETEEKADEDLFKFHKARLRFKRRPDLLWILNPNENRHVIEEAERLSIPTIGIVDSNTDLSSVTVSIPANDNGSFLVNRLITILITLSEASSKCL